MSSLPPTWKWERREANQKAIKICDHLFPLLRLIHLSGEWFCPYPPKATNLFSCLYPCIKMNLWNTQMFSFFFFFFNPFLSSVFVSGWLSFPVLVTFFPPFSPPFHSPGFCWALCLPVLTFSFLGARSRFLSLALFPFHRVKNVFANPIQIVSQQKGSNDDTLSMPI